MAQNPEIVKETVHRQLRKAFKLVKQQQIVWQTASEETHSLISSLANLAEQLQCLHQTGSDEQMKEFRRQFPDLYDRLDFKLRQSMEVVLHKVTPCLAVMEGVCKKLSHDASCSVNTYHKHYKLLGVAKASERKATWPSIADMLEWLADVCFLYKKLFAEKRWLYDTVSYDNLGALSSLPSRWCKNEKELMAVEDILANVMFFMADR